MSTSALLEVQGLRAGYGETEVLRGVDLSVEAGEIVAVLGSNGVGKSTLNRTLSGIVRRPSRRHPLRRRGDRARETGQYRRARPHSCAGRPPYLLEHDGEREISILAATAARGRSARETASASSAFSRACANARRNMPARFPAASSRCWPLAEV